MLVVWPLKPGPYHEAVVTRGLPAGLPPVGTLPTMCEAGEIATGIPVEHPAIAIVTAKAAQSRTSIRLIMPSSKGTYQAEPRPFSYVQLVVYARRRLLLSHAHVADS